MTGAWIILGVTVVVGFLLWFFDKRSNKSEEPQPVENEQKEESEEKECCGLHIVCEKDSLSPFTTEIEYYEDEELDRFRGRKPDEYSPEEADEFRDVMLTLRPEEIAGWSRSLQLREVSLPADVREELLLLISDLRKTSPNL